MQTHKAIFHSFRKNKNTQTWAGEELPDLYGPESVCTILAKIKNTFPAQTIDLLSYSSGYGGFFNNTV